MILALDSVFEHCSVALLANNGDIVFQQTLLGNRKQTQQILPMINAGLQQTGITLSELTAIAFNRGPGAFSGIRINTAVAQALSFAHDIPCLPISSLQAIAQTAYQMTSLTQLYAVIDARMSQVYLAEFALADDSSTVMQLQHQEQLVDYYQSTKQALPLVGNGANLLSTFDNQIVINDIIPNAVTIGLLGLDLWQQGQSVCAKNALPVYLRHHAWKTLSEQQSMKN